MVNTSIRSDQDQHMDLDRSGASQSINMGQLKKKVRDMLRIAENKVREDLQSFRLAFCSIQSTKGFIKSCIV